MARFNRLSTRPAVRWGGRRVAAALLVLGGPFAFASVADARSQGTDAATIAPPSVQAGPEVPAAGAPATGAAPGQGDLTGQAPAQQPAPEAKPAEPVPKPAPDTAGEPQAPTTPPSATPPTNQAGAPAKGTPNESGAAPQAPGAQPTSPAPPVNQETPANPVNPANGPNPGAPIPAPAVGNSSAPASAPSASAAPAERAPSPSAVASQTPAAPLALAIPRTLAAVAEAVDRLAADHAANSRRLDFGALGDGRKLPALLFGGDGPLALEERPVVMLLGSLDGESPMGGLAVLHVAAELLREPASLPAGVAYAAVPWASPEGLELVLAGRSADGRNVRPVDEDRDRRFDEDGPDDLDGDGVIVQMLVEDPEGPWVRPAGQRLIARARPGDAPRFTLALEGKDDDGDGRFNEDGPGGVVLDLNFPVGREGPWKDNLAGALPLSETLAKDYAEFALARRAAVVILFQGNHGRMAIPGGSRATSSFVADADRGVYEKLAASFAAATGRRSGAAATLLECRGRERRGAAIDWFYSVAGALAVEVAPWGPALDAPAEAAPENARFDASKPDDKKRSLDGVPAEDLAWIRYLDDTAGGIGFIDWHPVDVGAGRQVLVGGFEPGARTTPPPEQLPRALQGLAEFARRVSGSLPRLELRVSEARRDGEVCRIRARVSNVGQLPTGLSISDRRPGGGGAWLALELPPGAKLIAGSERCSLARLAGGGTSRECEWLVVAPAGSSFALRAGGDWAIAVAKEVTP